MDIDTMRQFLLALNLLAGGFLTACAPEPPAATLVSTPTLPPSVTYTISPSATPTRASTTTPSMTPTPSASPTPDPCDISQAGPLTILDDDTYFSFGPTSNEMDRALVAAYPEWEAFRQVVCTDPWTAGGVFDQASFGGPEYGVNPAILMISVMMRLNWVIPIDGNMYLRAVQAAKEMFPHYDAYYTEEQVRSAYPHIGNAATYSLYRFFGKDEDRLHKWCTIYGEMFGAKYPLKH